MKKYIIAGPTTIGNIFGVYGTPLFAGKFAIVEDDEYANGGCGPSTVNGKLYASRRAAETALAAMNAPTRWVLVVNENMYDAAVKAVQEADLAGLRGWERCWGSSVFTSATEALSSDDAKEARQYVLGRMLYTGE